jgi:hypothetical protein
MTLINWARTSWGSLERWREEASQWACPVANEYQSELPASENSRFLVFATNCGKGCQLNSEPDPPWEPCPFWQAMAKEFVDQEMEEEG